MLAQDASSALVDSDLAPHRLRVLEPELEARLACPAWAAKRVPPGSPAAAARSVPCSVPLQITTGMPASLAISAAATLLRMPPEPKAEVRSPIARPSSSEKSSTPAISSAVGSWSGSRAVEPVDVGQQDQQPRLEQQRDLGGEEVVVAEADLVGRGGVVLVDHRHHPPLDQPPQRLAGVEVVGPGGDVGSGQQHLGRAGPVARQAALVSAVEVALPDRRGGLQLVHRPRPHRQLHQPHPPRDRPRGDHHDPLPALLQGADLLADGIEHVGAQLTVIGGDDRGSELDHKSHDGQSSRDRRGRPF